MSIKNNLTDLLPRLGSLRATADVKHGAPKAIITTPHDKAEMPPWLPSDDILQGLEAHEISDIGSGELAAYIATIIGAQHIAARYSRQYVDLNRSLLDPASIPDREKIDHGDLAGRLYESNRFHRELIRAVNAWVPEGTQIYLINLHSFNRSLDGEIREVDIGIPVPDFSQRESVALFEEIKQRAGKSKRQKIFASKTTPKFRVVKDAPYSGNHPGNHLSKKFKHFKAVTPLTIEVCNDLLLTPEDIRKVGNLICESLIALASNPMTNTKGDLKNAY